MAFLMEQISLAEVGAISLAKAPLALLPTMALERLLALPQDQEEAI